MFCSNCGMQIADNAKFCYNCGTANSMYKEDIGNQDNNDSNNVLKKIKDQIGMTAKNSKKISDLEVVSEESVIDCMIYNNKIGFSKKDLDNITILQRLIGQASIGRNEILEYQRQMYSTDQIKQLEKEVELRFFTLDDTIKELLEELNLNYEFTTVFKYRGIITVFDKIRDVEKQIFQEIELAEKNKEDAIEYNEMRKASRGRIVGGGFGFKGAIKGMLTASALNTLSGAAYSVRNVFAEVSINSQYRNLVNSIKSKSFLDISEIFYDDCLKLIDLFLKGLTKSGYYMKYTLESKKEADRIFRDLCLLREEKFVQIPKLFTDILKLYPINEEYYIGVCSRIGDEKGEIISLAQQLNLDITDIKKAIVSREYQKMLIGDYVPLLKKLIYDDTNISTYKVESQFRPFIEYDINYWLEKDSDNVVSIFFANLKNHLYKGDTFYYTFEYGRNKNLLVSLKSIDFTWQEPMALFWSNMVYDSYLKDDSRSYILLTSENLYTNKHTIPIMDIYGIKYTDRLIVINNNYSVEMDLFNDRTTETVLFTEVLFLQLLHEKGKTPKNIPLLERKYLKHTNRNIFYTVKPIVLDDALQVHEGIQEEVSHKKIFYGNHLDELGVQYFQKVLQLENDEYMIICFWNKFYEEGFAISNKRLIYSYIHEKEGKYCCIPLEEYSDGDIQMGIGECEILNNKIPLTRKDKIDERLIWLCMRIVAEIKGEDEKEIPNTENVYGSHIETKIIERVIEDLQTETDYEVIVKTLFMSIDVLNDNYMVYLHGMQMNEKNRIRVSSFGLANDEKIFYSDGLPLFAKPTQTGSIITNKGIHYIESGNHNFLKWEDFPLATILWNRDGRIIINDNIELVSYKECPIGKFVKEIANLLGAEILAQKENGTYINRGGEIIEDTQKYYEQLRKEQLQSSKTSYNSANLKEIEWTNEEKEIFCKNAECCSSHKFFVVGETGNNEILTSILMDRYCQADEQILAVYSSIVNGFRYNMVITNKFVHYDYEKNPEYISGLNAINMENTVGKISIDAINDVTVYTNWLWANVIFKANEKIIVVFMPDYSVQETQYIGYVLKIILDKLKNELYR